MFRFATAADAEHIARIQIETWQAVYRGLVPDAYLDALSVPQRTERWRKGIEADPRQVMVDTEGETIVGWVAVGRCRDVDATQEGEIYAIYVDHRLRGRGIGKRLMTAAESELRNRGHARITLWVIEGNLAARAFYANAAYAPDGGSKQVAIGDGTVTEVRYAKSNPVGSPSAVNPSAIARPPMPPSG